MSLLPREDIIIIRGCELDTCPLLSEGSDGSGDGCGSPPVDVIITSLEATKYCGNTQQGASGEGYVSYVYDVQD